MMCAYTYVNNIHTYKYKNFERAIHLKVSKEGYLEGGKRKGKCYNYIII